jgi:hypothetical protein
LGTDTAGDYVAGVTGGTGVTVTGGSGEGSTPSIAIGQAIGATDSPSFNRVTSTVATGTAPLTVASTTVVTNLNADLLDGQSGSYYRDLTNMTAGTLAVARGGTNSTATPTAGGIDYGTGTAHAFTAAGTTGQVLVSNGSSAPTWGGGVWTSFTSSISASAGSPSLGTSPTNHGYYVQNGKTVTGFIRAICGTSPTSASGGGQGGGGGGATYYFSLPVAARQVIANVPCGTFHFTNGSTFLTGLVLGVATDKVQFMPQNGVAVTNVNLGTLVSGTTFNIFFTYEAS